MAPAAASGSSVRAPSPVATSLLSWKLKSVKGVADEGSGPSVVCVVSQPIPGGVTLGTGIGRQSDYVNSHSQAPLLELEVGLAAPQTCRPNGGGGSPREKYEYW